MALVKKAAPKARFSAILRLGCIPSAGGQRLSRSLCFALVLIMFFPQLTYATNYCVGAVGSGKCPAGYSGVTNDTRWTAQANVPTDIQDFIIDENMKLTLGGANPGSTLDLNVTGTLYVLGKLTTNGSYTDNVTGYGVVLRADSIYVSTLGIIEGNGTGFRGSRSSSNRGDGPGGGYSQYASGGQGAAHGGSGGRTDSNFYQPKPYGSIVYPTTLGSGGGAYDSSTNLGGNGGNALMLFASSIVEVNGTINASGISNPSWTTAGGGGSGGAILINASTIKGNGKLEAKGGNKGSYTTPGGGSEGVGKGCNYNQTGQPKLTVRQQRIMDVVNTRRYMAGTSAGEMDIVPRQYQRQLLAIPAQKTPSLPIPFTTPSLGEFHADLQPQVKILNELIGRLQSSTATTSLTSTQGQSQLRKLIQLETQLQERITSRLQGRFQTQAKTQTQMQTQMQIQLQRMRTPQPRIITMLFLPENKNGRLGSPGRRFSLKTGAHIEGERSALADLLSVNKSLSEYGRATHPSFRKRPELWPGASSITGHVPTVEQLHTEPKHEAPSRLSKLLNQTGRRLL